MSWEGGGLMITVALLTFSIVYFPFCFYFFCDKKIKNQNMLLTVITGIFLLPLAPSAVLFALQHWDGASILLITGIIGALISLGVTLYLRRSSPAELATYYRNMVIRTSGWSCLSIMAAIYHWVA